MGTSPSVLSPALMNSRGATGVVADRASTVNFGKALMIVAAGDGVISEAEKARMFKEGRIMGTPEDILEEIAAFDYKKGDLDACLAGITAAAPSAVVRKNLMYSAIRLALADGYAAGERAAAAKAAAKLGITPPVLAQIEAVAQEREDLDQRIAAFNEKRRALLAP